MDAASKSEIAAVAHFHTQHALLYVKYCGATAGVTVLRLE